MSIFDTKKLLAVATAAVLATAAQTGMGQANDDDDDDDEEELEFEEADLFFGRDQDLTVGRHDFAGNRRGLAENLRADPA